MVVLVGAMTVGVGPARAATSEKEREAELNARQAFAAARYDEAIELFARLYAETLNPIYLRNIGRCHQKKREPDKALDAFHDYLAKGKSVSSAERKEINGYIKEMEQLRDDQAKDREARAKVAFVPAPPATPPAPATTTTTTTTASAGPSSGVTAMNLTPAPNPGYGAPPAGTDGKGAPVLISRAGDNPPPAEDHPVYTRWWFWTAIGVVVAGGVAAALLIPGGVTKPTCPASAMGQCS